MNLLVRLIDNQNRGQLYRTEAMTIAKHLCSPVVQDLLTMGLKPVNKLETLQVLTDWKVMQPQRPLSLRVHTGQASTSSSHEAY